MNITFIEGGVCAPAGFTAGGVHCGIRKNKEKRDLALIFADRSCAAAAVYTQNLVKGAPLLVTREHLANGRARAVICNSGNANTCNADGVYKAKMMCDIAAEVLSIPTEDVLVASTGVIGQVLPISPIAEAAGALRASLGDHSLDAAEAIMTTDTRPKNLAVEFELGGKTCRIGAIAKGSGMIHPNMATMLCFLTTDVAIQPQMLQTALKAVADDTFNMISVDGDTSTNDMAVILASGAAGNPEIASTDGEGYSRFTAALFELMRAVSKLLAGDGEGATRLIECNVNGAATTADAKMLAKSVICSSLTKAAIFGADANWGRVLCALGYAGAELDVEKVGVEFRSAAGSVIVCENGAGVDFDEETAKRVLSEEEIVIDVTLGDGAGAATAWGCDLTYDYVKINGDYRT
ncbi:MAG: bifunctional glutamate N-acetyltransferase/amino-acid acetyltransferase ArgJ [Candidatus Howiella sp.]|jgi:glutamate N-acetyltransferase/amino-acid N-acetyltransferase